MIICGDGNQPAKKLQLRKNTKSKLKHLLFSFIFFRSQQRRTVQTDLVFSQAKWRDQTQDILPMTFCQQCHGPHHIAEHGRFCALALLTLSLGTCFTFSLCCRGKTMKTYMKIIDLVINLGEYFHISVSLEVKLDVNQSMSIISKAFNLM